MHGSVGILNKRVDNLTTQLDEVLNIEEESLKNGILKDIQRSPLVEIHNVKNEFGLQKHKKETNIEQAKKPHRNVKFQSSSPLRVLLSKAAIKKEQVSNNDIERVERRLSYLSINDEDEIRERLGK